MSLKAAPEDKEDAYCENAFTTTRNIQMYKGPRARKTGDSMHFTKPKLALVLRIRGTNAVV